MCPKNELIARWSPGVLAFAQGTPSPGEGLREKNKPCKRHLPIAWKRLRLEGPIEISAAQVLGVAYNPSQQINNRYLPTNQTRLLDVMDATGQPGKS